MEYDKGKTLWVFPDLELPPKGNHELEGHESIIVLNMNDVPANLKITLYFEDREPVCNITAAVMANRVRCLRPGDPSDMCGVNIERCMQYAMRLQSDVPVVAQYGRLDTRDQPMAFYTVMGYSN
jgi:hypothetical protein